MLKRAIIVGVLLSIVYVALGMSHQTYDGYKLLQVDGGNLSGTRQANVVVDIGFGDRDYYAFTNEFGQLVKVTAKVIILQNDKTEHVTDEDRYYADEAKVPGTESETFDEGHVIADSLGGVSNAYNITPQDSVLNRHGEQAYMEKVIRDAGGCRDFVAIITYPDTRTQIPSHYSFTYTLKGNIVNDEFDNVNPESNNNVVFDKEIELKEIELKEIDTNGNGKVTIAEAVAAGYKIPITSENWLYKYMNDKDGDGVIGN